ncbi:MAG: hypothetical protein AABW72_04365 [archaeon]
MVGRYQFALAEDRQAIDRLTQDSVIEYMSSTYPNAKVAAILEGDKIVGKMIFQIREAMRIEYIEANKEATKDFVAKYGRTLAEEIVAQCIKKYGVKKIKWFKLQPDGDTAIRRAAEKGYVRNLGGLRQRSQISQNQY